MVKADKVSKVTQTLVARAKAGQIRAKIDDAQLVEILGDAGASERSVTVEVSAGVLLWFCGQLTQLTPLHITSLLVPCCRICVSAMLLMRTPMTWTTIELHHSERSFLQATSCKLPRTRGEDSKFRESTHYKTMSCELCVHDWFKAKPCQTDLVPKMHIGISLHYEASRMCKLHGSA